MRGVLLQGDVLETNGYVVVGEVRDSRGRSSRTQLCFPLPPADVAIKEDVRTGRGPTLANSTHKVPTPRAHIALVSLNRVFVCGFVHYESEHAQQTILQRLGR